MFLDVLETLTMDGPLRVTHLMRKTGLHFPNAKKFLSFAIDNFAVNKKGYTYSITPVGILLYKALDSFSRKKRR